MKKIGEILCEIFEFENDITHTKVRVHYEKSENEFKILLVCAEYLTQLVAQQSHAGYEKALDLIREGAMTYRTSTPEL